MGTIAKVDPAVTVIIVTQELPTHTPSFFGNEIDRGFFISSIQPDCRQACWQGLVIGQSNQADVQEVFSTVFPLDENINFFDENLWSPESNIDGVSDIEGLDGGGYSWFDSDKILRFVAVVDEESRVVEGLNIYTGSLVTYWAPRTIQKIIQEFGVPDGIYGRAPNLERTTSRVYLLYKEGYVFRTSFDAEIISNSQGEERLSSYCLDAPPQIAEDIVIEPFEMEGDNLFPSTRVVNEWIRPSITNMVPSEEAFGLTPEEFAAYAFEEDPCFEIDESLFEAP